MSAVTIYSDGGGEKSSTAAGACIVEIDGVQVFRGVAFLGEATNNESEITGALLGFSYLVNANSQGSQISDVHWVADSEYTLKSATEYIRTWQRNGWKTSQKLPVKNQGLWKTYLQLAKGLSISPEHVRGHSGHPENEACDNASTWARENGADYLDAGPSKQNVKIISNPAGPDWVLVDARTFIRNVRSDSPDASDSFLLCESLAPSSSKRKAPQQITLLQEQEEPKTKSKLSLLLTKLEEAKAEAQKAKSSLETGDYLAKQLELLQKLVKEK